MKAESSAGALAPDGAGAAFNAPWQARAFAIARLLCESGRLDWEDFRARLIEAIGASEPGAAPGGRDGYYERFLEALVGLLNSRALLTARELAARESEIAAAPPPRSGPGGRLR